MKRFFTHSILLGSVLMLPLANAQTATPPPPVPAIPPDQQATKEQVDKLFAAMHLREQMKTMMTMMPALIQQQLAKEPLPKPPGGGQFTPQQQKAVRDLIDDYVRKSMNLYTADEMMNDMAAIYERHFTRDDVGAYIAFYTSTAGQHLLDAQPHITQEYMPVVMQRVQERAKSLADEQRKAMDDLIKSFQDSTPPKPQ